MGAQQQQRKSTTPPQAQSQETAKGSIFDSIAEFFGGGVKENVTPEGPNPHATTNDPLAKGTAGWGEFTANEAVNYQAKEVEGAWPMEGSALIQHGPDAPILDREPAQADLFQMVESSTAGATPVTDTTGSLSKPHIKDAYTPMLYLGDGPTADDVSQGTIGDCYFMAVIGTLAGGDQSHLTSMMSLSGNQFTANFWAKDPSTGDYFQVPTTVSTDLSYETNASGQLLPSLVGAGVLLGEAKPEAWWMDTTGTELQYWRQDAWEGAMWVSLLEKAYMRFAQDHGQYGLQGDSMSGATKDAAGNQVSGYEINDGGYEYRVFEMFYGPDLKKNDSRKMSLDVNSQASTVAANSDVIKALLRVNGAGRDEGKATMMTASASKNDHVERLAELIGVVLANKDVEKYPGLKRILARDTGKISAWKSETDTTKKDALLQDVAKNAEELAKPGNWPLLHAKTSAPMYQHLLEMSANVAHVGTDKSNGTRNIYSGHAYMVLGATFSDAEGAAMSFAPADLTDVVLAKICADKSVVNLRNPHHTNEPDMEGKGVADGKDDGAFTMSLSQFFLNYAGYDFANVKL